MGLSKACIVAILDATDYACRSLEQRLSLRDVIRMPDIGKTLKTGDRVR